MSTESLANKRQSQRPNKPAPPIPGLSAPKPSAPPRPSTQPQFNDTATLSDGAFSEPQSPSQAEDEANLSSQNPQSSDADTSQSGSQVPDKRVRTPLSSYRMVNTGHIRGPKRTNSNSILSVISTLIFCHQRHHTADIYLYSGALTKFSNHFIPFLCPNCGPHSRQRPNRVLCPLPRSTKSVLCPPRLSLP